MILSCSVSLVLASLLLVPSPSGCNIVEQQKDDPISNKNAVPVIIVEKLVSLPDSSQDFPQQNEKTKELSAAIIKYENAKEDLELLESRLEHISKRQGTEEGALGNEEATIQQFESKRNMNEVFHHPRLQTPENKQVDFDDSTSDGQEPLTGPQKFDRNPSTIPELKPPLLLTLGGYQRPFEQVLRQPRILPSVVQNPNKDDGSGEVNKIVPHVVYNEPSFLNIPGMGYEQPLNQPPIDYNPNVIVPYRGLPQTQQIIPNNIMDFNQALLQRSNGNRYLEYPQNRPNNPPRSPQDAQQNIYGVNLPLNNPSVYGFPVNPFYNYGYQQLQYPRVNNEVSQSVEPAVTRGDILNNPSNFFGGASAPRQLNPYAVPYTNYQNAFQFQQPRIFPIYPNVQPPFATNALNEDRKNEEQESESVSQEQLKDGSAAQNTNNNLNNPIRDGLYVNIPSTPIQNSTNKHLPPIKFLNLPPDYLQRHQHPFYNGQNLPNFPVIGDNSQNQPTSSEEAKTNNSYLFDEYLKNLRSPLPFAPNPPFDGRFLVPNERGRGNSTTGRRLNNNSPASAFDFFNIRRPSNRARINPDTVPSCAKQTNSTICFDDEEYPMNEVLYLLDSEGPMLQRLLPPFTFEGSLNERPPGESASSGDSDICQVDVKYGQPKRALDDKGKWKVVVNVGVFSRFSGFAQNVRIETCRNSGSPCSHTDTNLKTECVQKESLQRFLTWDNERGLHMSLIKLPVACACQVIK